MQEIYRFLFELPIVVTLSIVFAFFFKSEFQISKPKIFAIKLTLIGILAIILFRGSDLYRRTLFPPNEVSSQLSQRIEFAKSLQVILKDPKLLNAEIKEKLIKRFNLNTLPQAEKDFYYKSLYDFYDCQMAFYQDAYAAFTTKVPTKSDRRKICQQTSGQFFGIELLLPKEQSIENDRIIQKIANGQIIESQGQPLKISDQFFQENIGEQIRNLNGLKFFFDKN